MKSVRGIISTETIKRSLIKTHLSASYIIKSLHKNVTETDILVLNSEYRTEFKHLKQLIEEFEVLAKEEDDEGEVADDVELYKSQLATLQASFRKANVQCQLNVNLKNKSELFYSDTANMEVRSRQGRNKEDLIKMSSNVTSNLSKLANQLANVVEQSRGTLDILAQSSQTVTENQEEFKVMGSALTTTKNLVSRFGRRETTDMILIVLALIVFFTACVYVIQKRMF
uniref:EOG090X0EO1 n=1 Tax=Eubosmina coregoni TaxID=186181 RepID=A0A4Y7LN63_9CRUS|nr:EOG090X0EO1 [Eubosmina coregoni]SVE70091.1 EOG090X0EO1 [Eubosmina coregoni]